MVANMRYEVCGPFPVLEVAPGGVVEHADLEKAQANVDALLQAGLIKVAEKPTRPVGGTEKKDA